MPVSRMRMRPWLEKMIESNSINGLAWVDKEKTMFSIPWKHAARHGWELDKDACLFKEWAIHTGKYTTGQVCDPKTWKANFRCAMNSLPDIEEVKDKSINKGHQAMRVFRMLPAVSKSRDKRSKSSSAKLRRKRQPVKEEEESDYSETQSPMNTCPPEEAMSTQENTVDSTVNMDSLGFDLSGEVPELSHLVEIETDPLQFNFPHRFEVSPEHSPGHSYTPELVELLKSLDKDTHWTYSTGTEGFLHNEACTSPESEWSESSSVGELDETPRYTTLGTESRNSMSEFWNIFHPEMFDARLI
ncbi:interferon regulatory factor 1b isoform X1 [Cyprinodon tularosa]|uniref:interferon regulatory factor 1b isoform X1 n=1 Tax=Cyprinodon tularosa TaxID=77115 RepID=UPI0018E2175B|nr:interferon regulatory factor 1b isoform X1 [Cyprinodon tularosa]